MRRKASSFRWCRPISIQRARRRRLRCRPATASGADIYNLYTAQLQVSYTFDVWGLNRRAVESLQALADVQRFQVEAAYLALTSNVVVAAITEASLRGQIDATIELIAINGKMLGILQRQLDTGYANASDVAVQEAALAQAKATLPPLRKALAQQRDLLAALSGAYPERRPGRDLQARRPAPAGRSAGEPAVATDRAAPGRARGGGTTARRQRAGRRRHRQPAAELHHQRHRRLYEYGARRPDLAAEPVWELAGNATQTVFDAGTLLHQLEGARDTYQAAAWTYRGTVVGAVQNVADALRALQNDADALRAARDFERAAKMSLDLAQQQLDKGQGNVLLQLKAEQTYLQASIQVVQAQAARLADTAALFQALGGGWWNRAEPPAEKTLDVGTGQAKPIQRDAPPQ